MNIRLVTLITNVAKFLETGAPFFRDEILATLGSVEGNIAAIRVNYEDEAPEGAEGIRECMLETLALFEGACSDVREFLASGDQALLRQAVARAEEADDILGYIEYQIDQTKLWMSEYTAG